MTRTEKALYAALACILLGGGLILAVGVFNGFDYERAATVVTSQETTRTFAERFSGIDADIGSRDLRLLPSPDGVCRLVFGESRYITCSAEVKDGVLHLRHSDERPWYRRIGITLWYNPDFSITLYLPEQTLQSLAVNSTSGDLYLSGGLRFDEINAESVSGELVCRADVTSTLHLKSSSSDIEAVGIKADAVLAETSSGEIDLKKIQTYRLEAVSTSGDIELENCRSAALALNTASGELELADSLCEGEMLLSSGSGEITLKRVDAGSCQITTTSGDVEGTFLTEKNFIVQSISGEIRLPASVSGAGDCRISTTSGDIEIRIA